MRLLVQVITTAILSLFFVLHVQAETLVRGLAMPPVNLDPHFFHSTTEASVLKDIFEGLVVQDEFGLPVPGAAESWSVSGDGLVWTFTLRKNMSWSDGTSLSSEDFLYSFRRLANPDTQAKYSWYLQLAGVTNGQSVAEGKLPSEALGVTAPDAHTIVITLNEPRSWLPALMTFPSFLPVPRHAIETCGEGWDVKENCAASNGAYKFVVRDGDAIRLQRNQHFHDLDKVNIVDVTWQVFADPVDELIALRAGELDVTTGRPLGSLAGEASSMGGTSQPVSQLITSYLVVNPKDKVLGNHHLRKALAGVLDKDAIFPAIGKPAWTLTPPWTHGASDWLPDDSSQAQWLRDKLARDSLFQAGYSKDNPVKIEYLTVESPGKTDLYNESIVAQWRRLPGVEVDIVYLSLEDFFHRYLSGNFQIVHSAWLAAFNDPSAFLLLGGRTSPYSLGVMGEEYDEMLQQAMSEVASEKQQSQYQSLEKQLISSKAIIPLKHLNNVHWLQPRVKGFTATNPEGWVTSMQLKIN